MPATASTTTRSPATILRHCSRLHRRGVDLRLQLLRRPGRVVQLVLSPTGHIRTGRAPLPVLLHAHQRRPVRHRGRGAAARPLVMLNDGRVFYIALVVSRMVRLTMMSAPLRPLGVPVGGRSLRAAWTRPTGRTPPRPRRPRQGWRRRGRGRSTGSADVGHHRGVIGIAVDRSSATSRVAPALTPTISAPRKAKILPRSPGPTLKTGCSWCHGLSATPGSPRQRLHLDDVHATQVSCLRWVGASRGGLEPVRPRPRIAANAVMRPPTATARDRVGARRRIRRGRLAHPSTTSARTPRWPAGPSAG